MKRNILIALICLISLQANALIVSVEGYGDIPETGMEITINEAEMDELSGEWTMGIEGTLLCNGSLSVTISRSSAGLADEFCCAGQCTGGNEELSETLYFSPEGIANWFVHYYPAVGSYETVIYGFDDGSETRTLTVHYDYTTQGIEGVDSQESRVKKELRDGIIYIIKDNKKYTIL